MAVLSNHDASPEPRLEKARHIKYWTRCLKTLLPHQYTSNDSNRMFLAYFVVAALDLLGALNDVSTASERKDYVDWIYHCQHPDGGFRMWPGTDFGKRANASNAKWDPPHIPATYFALATLLILDDDFKRVKRKETLAWLFQMQRPDGSFGETSTCGNIEGGRDARFGYCAAGIRHILRDPAEGDVVMDGQTVRDINIDALVRCVKAAETYDGGIADEPFHEPQAGYTFCSLGSLAFVDRLNLNHMAEPMLSIAPNNPQAVLKWLVARQTELTLPDGDLDTEFGGMSTRPDADQNSSKDNGQIDEPPHQDPHSSSAVTMFDLLVDGAGMNGRPNKVADTCYAFWVGASLHILEQPAIFDQSAVRRYLLGKTQHPVLGGFGKFPDDLPDLYHSYLGLAALSLAGSDQVKKLDGAMCLSREARERLPALWQSWRTAKE